jgi:hypothetical protein
MNDYSKDDLSEYYKVAKNCYDDLCMVRKLFSTRTTEKEAKAGWKALQIMKIYCPKECVEPVDATIYEFEWRMKIMGLDYVWTEPEGVE